MANFLHDIYIMKYAAIHVPSWFRTSSSHKKSAYSDIFISEYALLHGKNTLIKTSRRQSLLLVAMVSITPEDKVLL